MPVEYSVDYHLAQVNVARMRGRAEDPVMADMIRQVAWVNELAESSPGFVWRMPGAQVTAEDLRLFEGYFEPFEPERIFYNMSVWERVEHLSAFVYRSRHTEVLRRKHDWIEAFDKACLAMWWVPAGHRPTVAESARRLRLVHEQGPSPEAFTFAQVFPRPITQFIL